MVAMEGEKNKYKIQELTVKQALANRNHKNQLENLDTFTIERHIFSFTIIFKN